MLRSVTTLPSLVHSLLILLLAGGLASCDTSTHVSKNPASTSHMSTPPALVHDTYPDINTVPFGETATASRAWHGDVPEDHARKIDQQSLDDARTLLSQQGDTLRAEAGLPPR